MKSLAITYATRCAGDLGICVGDHVVALLFLCPSDPVRFAVHDVVRGGPAEIFETLRAADDALFIIARRELALAQNAELRAAQARGERITAWSDEKGNPHAQ